VEQFSAFKTIHITLAEGEACPQGSLQGYGEVIHQQGSLAILRVPKAETAQTTARLLSQLNVDDLTVEDPPIEEVIEQVFSQISPGEVTPFAAGEVPG
jgi:ABC-2 type transport system ATP-binding protein